MHQLEQCSCSHRKWRGLKKEGHEQEGEVASVLQYFHLVWHWEVLWE